MVDIYNGLKATLEVKCRETTFSRRNTLISSVILRSVRDYILPYFNRPTRPDISPFVAYDVGFHKNINFGEPGTNDGILISLEYPDSFQMLYSKLKVLEPLGRIVMRASPYASKSYLDLWFGSGIGRRSGVIETLLNLRSSDKSVLTLITRYNYSGTKRNSFDLTTMIDPNVNNSSTNYRIENAGSKYISLFTNKLLRAYGKLHDDSEVFWLEP